MLAENNAVNCSSVISTYVFLHMSASDTVRSVLIMYPKLLQMPNVLSNAVKMYIAFHQKNFIRFYKLLMDLITTKDFLPLFALSTIVNEVRFEAITVLCHSHSSKLFHFNASDLCKWLLLSAKDDVLRYCAEIGLTTTTSESVIFLKSNTPRSIRNHTRGCRISQILEELQNEKLTMYLLDREK